MSDHLDKKVAQLIVKAQMCSDSGKGIDNNFYHPGWKKRANKFGYDHKRKLIIMAMDRIAQLHGTSGFHFYIGSDKELYDCTVVYFNFKIYDERFQISFHVPEGIPSRYMKTNSKHYTKWDHKSSVRACYELMAWMGC
jgi:hypothetical protein